MRTPPGSAQQVSLDLGPYGPELKSVKRGNRSRKGQRQELPPWGETSRVVTDDAERRTTMRNTLARSQMTGYPFIHTVGLAQLVRASDCGSEGRGFEPRISPFLVG